jgi:hypothetical protein
VPTVDGDKIRELLSNQSSAAKKLMSKPRCPANLTVDMIMGPDPSAESAYEKEDDVCRKIFQSVCGDKLPYQRYLVDVIIQRHVGNLLKNADSQSLAVWFSSESHHRQLNEIAIANAKDVKT